MHAVVYQLAKYTNSTRIENARSGWNPFPRCAMHMVFHVPTVEHGKSCHRGTIGFETQMFPVCQPLGLHAEPIISYMASWSHSNH